MSFCLIKSYLDGSVLVIFVQFNGHQLATGNVPLSRHLTKRSMQRLRVEIKDRMDMFDSGTGRGIRRRSSMRSSRDEPFVFEHIVNNTTQPHADNFEVQIAVQVTPFMRSGGIIGHLKR